MRTCAGDSVPILRGHNRWVLARTDRDAPTAEAVRETAGAFLSRVLGRASPTGTRSIFEALSPPGSEASRYVIGAARPVDVQAVQPESLGQALDFVRPEGRMLGSYNDCEVVRTVNAARPWIVVANFDWRGQETRVAWPKRRVNDLGFPVESDHDLDWLLMGASYTGKARTKDTSLANEMSEGAKRELRRAASGALWVVPAVVIVGAGAYLVHRKFRRRAA